MLVTKQLLLTSIVFFPYYMEVNGYCQKTKQKKKTFKILNILLSLTEERNSDTDLEQLENDGNVLFWVNFNFNKGVGMLIGAPSRWWCPRW